MWYILIAQQVHFTVYALAALGFFAAGWLYYDALTKKSRYLIPRIIGYFSLALTSLIQSIDVSTTLFPATISAHPVVQWLSLLLPTVGLLCIFLSFSFDPIQKRPVYKVASAILWPAQLSTALLLPLFSGMVSALYYIQVAEGLEWHLIAPSLTFLVYTIFQIAHSLGMIFGGSDNALLFQLFSPYGPVWWLEHIALLITIYLLLRWVFWYLLKSFEIQIVIVVTAGAVLLTIIATTVFTNHLFRTLVSEITSQMTYSAKIYAHDIEGKKREALADARFLALDPQVQNAVLTRDTQALNTILTTFSKTRNIRGIVVLTPDGEHITKKDTDDILAKFTGLSTLLASTSQVEESVSIFAVQDVLSPTLYISAVASIRTENQTVGIVALLTPLDNAFVYGIKNETGLESTLFAANTLSVTSIPGADTLIGTTLANQAIHDTVLVRGETYRGETRINNTTYIGSYTPIVDHTNTSIGMIFVGRPLGEIFQLVAQAIEGTYILAVVLLLVSIVPSVLLARHIVSQIH